MTVREVEIQNLAAAVLTQIEAAALAPVDKLQTQMERLYYFDSLTQQLTILAMLRMGLRSQLGQPITDRTLQATKEALRGGPASFAVVEAVVDKLRGGEKLSQEDFERLTENARATVHRQQLAAFELLNGIDWPLLRQQKAWLASGGGVHDKFDDETCEGLLGLLDALQDFAVDSLELSEEFVFGPGFGKEEEKVDGSAE